MENPYKDIDFHELGRELSRARTLQGMTQAEAAKVIKAARTTLTAIEKGERKVKPDELIRLARAYSRDVSDFVRKRPKVEPIRVQFRVPHHPKKDDVESINRSVSSLADMARDYLELEEITNEPMIRKYPPEYLPSKDSVERVAEGIASRERNRLGLGDGPVPVLRELLEQEVGLKIFYVPLGPSNFSAIYMYEHQLGGCIAINSLHPEERRRWSLAHEYAHFLVHRYQPRIFVDGKYQKLPDRERFADAFALHFLLPSGSLARRFSDIKTSSGQFSPADLCILAHYYGVAVSTMARRLEDLGFLPTGLWDKLKDRGFKIREAQNRLGLAPLPALSDKFPKRYQFLAVYAFENDMISEGQLAKFLEVDRLDAREIVAKLREHESDITEDETFQLDMSQALEAENH